jgi:hypothetical protein
LQCGRIRVEYTQRAEGHERLLLVLAPLDASIQMSLVTGRDRCLLRFDFLDEDGDYIRVIGLVDPASAALCVVGWVVCHALPPSRVRRAGLACCTSADTSPRRS